MVVVGIALGVLLPVGIIAAILLVITILLLVADKLLVSYGECKIVVNAEGEKKEFTVEGGDKLLTALIDNGMKVPASCAGRGSCGFCKVNVASGGGQMLPTEEVFISKEEEQEGSRLACQVKVKNDIELFVPDLLKTVKNMAKSGSFDTRLKWSFWFGDKLCAVPDERDAKFDKKSKMAVADILARHEGMEGAILPVLHEINSTFAYLPEQAVRMVSREMAIPVTTVFRIATFYNAFTLEPRGKYTISVCMGTACYVKGSQLILDAVARQLSIDVGATSDDGMFTLETVSCLGCCGQAPVLTVNEDLHGHVTLKGVTDILKGYS